MSSLDAGAEAGENKSIIPCKQGLYDEKKWCQGTESNRRHADFQSANPENNPSNSKHLQDASHLCSSDCSSDSQKAASLHALREEMARFSKRELTALLIELLTQEEA